MAVSRFLFLNLPFIFATYPLASGGQPSSASIFGFAGPGSVPRTYHYVPVVSSYLAFSPLDRHPEGPFSGNFLLRMA